MSDTHTNRGSQLNSTDPKDKGGAKIVKWFDKLFTNVILMASLGAGFTFTVVLAPFNDEIKLKGFSADTVNTLVAVSWLCFLLDLAFASSLSSIIDFVADERIIKQYNNGDPKIHRGLIVVSFIVQALVLCGFLMASLAVSAFSPPVGWTAFGLTAIFTVLLIGMIFFQLRGFSQELKKGYWKVLEDLPHS